MGIGKNVRRLHPADCDERVLEHEPRCASVGTMAYWSIGVEVRVAEKVRNSVSLPLGLVSLGMYGSPMNVNPKLLEP